MPTQACVQSVAPAEPLAPWFGGKKYLARTIIERIDAIPHRCYAEPFVGMGGVFLRRSLRPKSEIINLFRVVREHADELARQFRWRLSSRGEFRRLIAVSPETLTDIQRAERMRRLIAAAHQRLQGVHVECLDWDVFLSRFDRPWTLFYIDPPYWSHENDYGKGIFSRGDFARMTELLRTIKGRFLLSLNDQPEVRELFGEFQIKVLSTAIPPTPAPPGASTSC